MVEQILMISSADPHEILILIKWWKNQPSSTSASACTQTLHYGHSGFGPILAYFCPKVLWFLRGEIFSCVGKHLKLSGINHQCKGNIWAKRSIGITAITPFLGQKCLFQSTKCPKKTCWAFLSKGGLTSGQNIQNRKKRLPKSCPLSELQELEVQICVCEFPHYSSDPVKQVS